MPPHRVISFKDKKPIGSGWTAFRIYLRRNEYEQVQKMWEYIRK
jgi:hypothetical protein